MREVNLSAVDLNLLVALEALLDEVSVSRAARRLGRSQPAVSRMLARLRDLFEDELLVREGRALVPTPRARVVHAPVKLLLAESRAVLAPPVAFDPGTASRTFRLLCSDYAQVVLLGGVMEELAESAPGLRLVVHGQGLDPVAALASGAVDLVVGPPSWCPRWGEFDVLGPDDWVCVARQESPAPGSLADYVSRHHVVVATGAGANPVDEALRALGASRNVRLQVSDFAGALFVVAQSDLVATVPRPVAERGAALLSLTTAEVPFVVEAPTVALIWPRRLSRDPAHAWLRAAVHRSLPRE